MCEEAVNKVVELMTTQYGNPSSLHTMGFAAEQELRLAREAVAQELSVKQEEVFFTSGGTESNNLAIFGAAELGRRYGKKIVTTAIEHPSVLRVMQELEKQGFQIEYLLPDGDGHISEESVFRAVTSDTILVSMMAINNEVGTCLPISAAAAAIKAAKAPAKLHVDAVQSFGKYKILPSKTGIDLLSVSAHKIHGPKGVGALYVSKNVRLPARTFGGGQEKNLRSGTEAMPAIGGFGAAVRALPNWKEEESRIKELNESCRKELCALPGVIIQSPLDASPYILNISVPGIRSEIFLHFLSARGIYLSSGSACAKKEKSHVLSSMGLPKRQIDASLRISFSRENTQEDGKALIEGIKLGLKELIKR